MAIVIQAMLCFGCAQHSDALSTQMRSALRCAQHSETQWVERSRNQS
ncbi:MAG: hypothetical protein HC827_21715 [Cyanobacteria bacterium RM1_2_2]|nr:hypothetical protein [Cyanobacteria bacterium RM1_2_2]